MIDRWLPSLVVALYFMLPSPSITLAQTTTPPAIAETGTIVGASSVNIRECPGLDCKVVRSVRLGDTVTVTGEPTDGFVPVTSDGQPGYAYALFVATPGHGTPELRAGLPGCNRVAFIFNLGVGYETNMELLAWMKQNEIPATIFPMGWWAEENRDLLKQMAADGFQIGSHGNVRGELTTRGDADVLADITDANDIITDVIGTAPSPYFTPYAAAIDERVRRIVAGAGYIPVGWEVSAADWDFGITADDVFQRVMPNVTDGSIIEFHIDAPTSATSTGVALPWIVERLTNKGYTFVTVADMALPCPPG